MKKTGALILLGTLITSNSATLVAAEDALCTTIVFHCPEDGCNKSFISYSGLKYHHKTPHLNKKWWIPSQRTFTKPDGLVQRVYRSDINPTLGRRKPQAKPITDVLAQLKKSEKNRQNSQSDSETDDDDDDKKDSSTSSSSSSSSSPASIPTRTAPPRLTYESSNANSTSNEEGECVCPVPSCQQEFSSRKRLSEHINSIHPHEARNLLTSIKH